MSDSKDMPFLQHLGEVRRRLIYCFVFVAFFSVCGFAFADKILSLLSQPFLAAFPPESIIGTGPAEAFILKLKSAVFIGIIFSLPFLFYHLWAFITPGLYPSEKKLLLPFVISSTILFICGAVFCYYLVFPFAFDFFNDQYKSINITPQIRISELLSFVITVLCAFGVIFEIPVLAALLARAGLLTDKILIAWARPAIVIIFIVAAVLTPPDVLTQLLMAVPLILLYLLSIFIVKITYRKHE